MLASWMGPLSSTPAWSEWGICGSDTKIDIVNLVNIWLRLSHFLGMSLGLRIHDVYRVGHPVPSLHLVYGFLVVHSWKIYSDISTQSYVQTWIWNLSISEYFHEKNSVAPHVGLYRELAVLDGLWGGPLDGEPRRGEWEGVRQWGWYLPCSLIGRVLIIHDNSGQAKVRHLGDEVFTYQDISSGQVSVNQSLPL